MRLAPRRRAAILIAAALTGLGTLQAVLLTGGVPNPLLNLNYLAVIMAAVAGGPAAGAAYGAVIGVLYGPLLGDGTGAGEGIAPWGWLIRLVAYVAAGWLVGTIWTYTRRQAETDIRQRAMREAVDAAMAVPDTAGACAQLLSELAARRPMVGAALYVIEPDVAYPVARWAVADHLLRAGQLDPPGQEELRTMVGAGRPRRLPFSPVVLSDEAGHELRLRGARSDLVIPLHHGGELIGALMCAETEEPHPLPAHDEVALTELAQGAAALLQRARTDGLTAARRAHDQIEGLLRAPRLLGLVFQPIVSLPSGGVAGYEALARFSALGKEPPNVWFARATAAGLGAELQALAVRRAREVAEAARLPAGCFLSINLSPAYLTHPDVEDALAGDLRRLVIELTEEEPVADYAGLRKVMERYRGRGARFAIDDAGAGYASLRHVTELRPDIVKLDAVFIRGLADSTAQQALLKALQAFTSEIGAALAAEGVETAAELEVLTAARLPVLVQGYALGRPAPPWSQPNVRATQAPVLDEIRPRARAHPSTARPR